MSKVKKYTDKIFEDIKHYDKDGNEYWEARELMKVLEYSNWQNFHKVIKEATNACKSSNIKVSDHFTEVSKMIELAKGAIREVKDYHLTRYACYLIVLSGDSRKEVIGLGKTYFTVKTRNMELLEDTYNLSYEDLLRLHFRDLTKKGNKELNYAARDSGVKNFDRFHNYGYRGLYNGETAADIFKRKGLRYREDILDNMGSDELAVNYFRITQTNQKLKNDNVDSEIEANLVHYDMGKSIRELIKSKGNIMPEDLPTPDKSLKQLEKEKFNKLM